MTAGGTPAFDDASLDEAARVIAEADSVALACHVDPDGDALGSMLALHQLCVANRKPSVASWPGPFVVAPHYSYLPGLHACTKPEDFPRNPAVMVTFDCGSMDRLAELMPAARAAAQSGALVVVDHHRSNEQYGTINVIDPDAAASAVLVRRLADRLGWRLTRDAALCLYTGVVTDTGRFQYENTTPEVFALATELASFDLPIAAITRQLFEEHRFAYLQLAAACLGRAQLDTDLGLVSAWITEEDLARYEVTVEETEGFIDLVRRAAEAQVACVLKETRGGVRVSLRAVSDVDVGKLATSFGGGGHRHAAGFIVRRPLAEVLDSVRAALAAQLAAADSADSA